jgi:ABC-type lipoprotein release transport system permease subunit
VDTSKTDIGLILPSQITIGSWFSGEDNQIIINKSYADKYGKKVGDEIILSNTKYKVIGIVEPKLYTNTTDFYLPISVLQKITGNENRINILLVKTTNANLVEQASSKLGELFTGATIVNSKDTAQKVTGSLVQAANLTNKFIGITSIIVVIASFIIVSLLVISAINKRVREIGTLKAIGWSNLEVIRQILSESIVLGILGAALGVVLGICAILILNHYNISFNATISSLNSTASNFFGRMDRARSSSTPSLETSVQLKVGINYVILALGAAVALSGAILSGFFAALKVSRLKPQVALRNLE